MVQERNINSAAAEDKKERKLLFLGTVLLPRGAPFCHEERPFGSENRKEAEFPEPEQFREIERVVLLKVIDRKWMDHIDDMTQLRQGIGLQAYGQRDPLVEYKMAGFDMFDAMISAIQEDAIRLLYHVQVQQKVEREQVAKVTGTNKDESAANAPKKRASKKVFPNEPCPCGSGKKYKQCCGKFN